MAQFVTHIQPTLLEASQGHLPHHHAHQVGMQHSSHLPHSGHNMPSPPTGHNHHQHQHQYQQQEQSPHHQSPPSQMSSPPATGGHHYHHQHQHHSQELQQQQHQQHHHHHIQGKQTTGGTGRHEHCPSGHQSSNVNTLQNFNKRIKKMCNYTQCGNTGLHTCELHNRKQQAAITKMICKNNKKK